KTKYGLDDFKSILLESQQNRDFTSSATLVTNVRHYEALKLAGQALERVLQGMDDSLPTDLLTQDIREALFHIGEIIGEVSTEEILGNIFSKFCIGK
ncbi:MAG: tRNA uridine-5-carboxymethylaminomethyl(34) synthesis GTPase MnmE, partial [Bacteroidales bacterium]|nr:tRNA uridine-5-carboxymethylaminomethyl(34) synthesis GTPase MnmE [Bacteroidales bacterium]